MRDTVAHLAGTDVEAVARRHRPQEFLAGLLTVAADVDGFLQGQLDERRDLSRRRAADAAGRTASTR